MVQRKPAYLALYFKILVASSSAQFISYTYTSTRRYTKLWLLKKEKPCKHIAMIVVLYHQQRRS